MASSSSIASLSSAIMRRSLLSTNRSSKTLLNNNHQLRRNLQDKTNRLASGYHSQSSTFLNSTRLRSNEPDLTNKHRLRKTFSSSTSTSTSSSSQAKTTTTTNLSSSGPIKSSYSDRIIVLGLLTLTGLVGIGLGGAGNQKKEIEKKSESTKVSGEQKESKKLDLDRTSDGSTKEEEATLESGSGTEDSEPSEQAAFNPDTGEINWDCPCLGGMAHGVCGEQFKAAFSCFVYSDQEPKGVECIDRFKAMQDCFKDHPDVYGPELTESDNETNPTEEEVGGVEGEREIEESGVTSPSSNEDLIGEAERESLPSSTSKEQ